MRRFCGWMVGLAMLLVLAGGCGSSGSGPDGNDGLVVRLVEFNGDGITQGDSVLPNSASVDVWQDLCIQTGAGQGVEVQISDELYTQTVVNAVFHNDQKLDVRFTSMVLHFDNPNVGFGDITEAINAVAIGGRCANVSGRPCAANSDCLVGVTAGNCVFSDTTVSGLLLVDFQAKAAVQPRIYGQNMPAKVVFHGSDNAGRSYQITAGYTVTFDDFCNCGTGEKCCATREACGL